jgi:hypothetical protein
MMALSREDMAVGDWQPARSITASNGKIIFMRGFSGIGKRTMKIKRAA